MDKGDLVTAVIVSQHITHPDMGWHITGKGCSGTGDLHRAGAGIQIGSGITH